MAGDFGPGTFYANFKNTAKLNYLEIPVLARFRFGEERRIYANAGPFAGFLLSAKNVTEGVSKIYVDPAGQQEIVIPDDPTDPNTPYTPLGPQNMGATVDGKSDLHAFNWGVQAGAGIERPIGRGGLSLDLRAGVGLANIQKDTATNGKSITGNVVIALGCGMHSGAGK